MGEAPPQVLFLGQMNSGIQGLDNKPRDYSEALAMLYGRNDLPLGHLRRIWTRISPQHQHVCHRRFIWKS